MARTMHFLGMVPTAMELYEQILKDKSSNRNEEIIQRARFNLHLIYKGAGENTGNHMRGLVLSKVENSYDNMNLTARSGITGGGDKLRPNAVCWKAHDLVMQNVI